MSDPIPRSPYAPPSDPTGPAAPPPPAPGPLNPWARLIGALTSPGATFRSIAARPTWIVAFLTILLIMTASTLALFSRLDREQMREEMRDRLRERMEAEGATASEETLAQLDKVTGAGVTAGFVVSVVMTMGGLLLLAALFMSFNLLGGDLRYKTSLAVTLHALLPWALGLLLVIPVVLGRGSVTMAEIQSQTVLPSSLASFAPEEAGPQLKALLVSFDLFALWTLALLILGFHVAARVSKATAAGVVIAFWVLWVGIKVGLASLAALGGAG